MYVAERVVEDPNLYQLVRRNKGDEVDQKRRLDVCTQLLEVSDSQWLSGSVGVDRTLTLIAPR